MGQCPVCGGSMWNHNVNAQRSNELSSGVKQKLWDNILKKASGKCSTGNCAKHVREIIEATFDVKMKTPESYMAKDYGDSLIGVGFVKIPYGIRTVSDIENLEFKDGDVIIFGAVGPTYIE